MIVSFIMRYQIGGGPLVCQDDGFFELAGLVRYVLWKYLLKIVFIYFKNIFTFVKIAGVSAAGELMCPACTSKSPRL